MNGTSVWQTLAAVTTASGNMFSPRKCSSGHRSSTQSSGDASAFCSPRPGCQFDGSGVQRVGRGQSARGLNNEQDLGAVDLTLAVCDGGRIQPEVTYMTESAMGVSA